MILLLETGLRQGSLPPISNMEMPHRKPTRILPGGGGGDDTIKYGAMAFLYNYVQDPKLNAEEYTFWGQFKDLKIEVNYMPEYFNQKTSGVYTKASYSHSINDKDAINISVGHYSFDDEKKITVDDHKSYTDHKICLTHIVDGFATEFMFTNTDRKNQANEKYRDRALTIILSKTF